MFCCPAQPLSLPEGENRPDSEKQNIIGLYNFHLIF